MYDKCDKNNIQNNLIKPLNQLGLAKVKWDKVLSAVSECGKIRREGFDEVLNDLLNGYTVLQLDGEKEVYTFNTQMILSANPQIP